ncbi:MAG: FtsX-like permease family protein, partial [Bryobacteraceae bacterium]
MANLLLARLAARQKEFAVRAAMGASRARLARQLFTENFILVAVATGLGMLLASWCVAGLRAWSQLNLPEMIQIQVDGRVLAACGGVAVFTGLLFGLGPALWGSRVDLRDALSQSGRQGASLGRGRAARFLIVSEISLALVLLAGAGLFLKSFHKLTSIDFGFDTKNLLTARLDLAGERFRQAENRSQFVQQALEKLRAMPGVQSASVWGPGMIGHATWVIEAIAEGRDPNVPRNTIMAERHSVNPGAIPALGVRIVRGRDFTLQDTATTPLVAIVSESAARAYWPGEDALGKRFRSTANLNWLTVVGIASDAEMRDRLDMNDAAIGIAPAGLRPQKDVYLPYPQRPNQSLVLALRVRGDAALAVKGLRETIRSVDPALPVYDAMMLEDRLANQNQSS